jgi:hypothetical protein
MSEIKVNKISPKQTCTQLTLGDSGDTIIIPSGATISNQGTAAGFGPTGAVSWDTTKKTTGFTATSGVGYFCDTTSAGFTVTLPSSPTAGTVIGICDYANTFATNNLTVGRNGSNIGGTAVNATLKVDGIAVTFVYVDSTQGWIVTDSGQRSDLSTALYVSATGGTITTCGNYRIHTFTGPGTFTVSCAGNATGSNSVDYLVVAGGGGSGRDNGGGGGAGGFRYSNSTFPVACAPGAPLASATAIPVSATGYPITVGAGGAANNPLFIANQGSPSIFSTITSTGGGYGVGCAGNTPAPIAGNGQPGGSGGGAGQASGGYPNRTGGTGNSPPVSPSQGNNGGSATVNCGGGAGGGGAMATGGGSSGTGGVGAGLPSAFGANGVPSSVYRYYSGGGGAGGSQSGGAGGAGGLGGGGPGGGDSISGTAGTANTGGGAGGGGQAGCGVSGGSGIVVIRYKYQ